MPATFLRRRAFGVLAASAAVGTAVPALAQATKIRVSTIPILDTAPLQIGIAKGFFAAEGLDVDTTPTAGGAAGLPALAAGQVQITFSNIISIVLGARQGLGFQVVAMGIGTSDKTPDLAGLISKKGAPFKTGKDLEGKRVAVNTRNNVLWLYAREWARVTGGDPDKITFLEVPFPQMIDAVRGDRVDAAFLVEPFLSAAISTEGMQLVAWPYNTVAKNVPVGMYAATKSYIDANPQVIERFARAYYKAADWANKNMNSEEFVKIVSGYTRLPAEKIKALALPPFEMSVTPERIDTVVALMRKHGMVNGPFDTRALLYRTAMQPPR